MGSSMSSGSWQEITQRNARSVQTLIGWIFWDPGAIRRYEAFGLVGPLGYIAARCAPLAPAGPEAVCAAFGSISPIGIAIAFDILKTPEAFQEVSKARDEAVRDGFEEFAAEAIEPLTSLRTQLWDVVDALPMEGRVLFATHRAAERTDDPLISAWHAVNCLREWRGDSHWAVVVAHGLTHGEASILHNSWVNYEPDWLARSRGTSDEVIDAGWADLERKGLAQSRTITPEGVAIRQNIEDQTDAITTLPWELLGKKVSVAFAETFEPPCEKLLSRVDLTAGPNYQPASRLRH